MYGLEMQARLTVVIICSVVILNHCVVHLK